MRNSLRVHVKERGTEIHSLAPVAVRRLPQWPWTAAAASVALFVLSWLIYPVADSFDRLLFGSAIVSFAVVGATTATNVFRVGPVGSGERLRGELDLASVTGELRATAHDAVRPLAAAVWLRSGEGRR